MRDMRTKFGPENPGRGKGMVDVLREFVCWRSALALAVVLALSLGDLASLRQSAAGQETTASANQMVRVGEIINVRAVSAQEMYKFEPAIARIPVRRVVRFAHGNALHASAPPIPWCPRVFSRSIPREATGDIKFEGLGIFGFRYRVHGRFGMVMIVAIGDELPNLENAKAGMPSGLAGQRMRELFAELEGEER